MLKKVCYIVNFYFGDRRKVPNVYNYDRLIFLKTQIETLKKYKNQLSKIVFTFNLETEHNSIFNEALKIIPDEINGTSIDIIIKENSPYMSYSAFAECYDEYKDKYDYYSFNEDDYYFVYDDWDTYLINKFNSYKDCGAICFVIKEPESIHDYKKHSGSGLFCSNESLRKVYDANDGLPYKNNKSDKDQYYKAENSQINMSFCFIEVGLNLYDIRDDFMFPFALNHGDYDIWLLYNWNEKVLIVPHVYYESIILGLYSHTYWISFNSQFVKNYKLSTTEEAKYLYENNLSYENKNNKKDLILITAYTPDDIRQKYLEELLLSIDKEKFDILISSHSSISEKAFDLCDYFLYSKENIILYDYKYKISCFFSNKNFTIYTTEYVMFNHIIAAGMLILNGICLARDKGYEKVHFLEYDSLIINDIEFIDNSKLLNNYSMVYYNIKHEFRDTVYSLFSLNLNKINNKWFDASNENFMDFLNKDSENLLEVFNDELKNLNETPSYLKELDKLNDNIISNRYCSSKKSKWVVAVYDKISNIVKIFTYNDDGIEINCIITINDNEKIFLNNNNIGVWTIRDLCDYDKLDKLKIEYDDVVKEYDFGKIDKLDFFKYNYINFY